MKELLKYVAILVGLVLFLIVMVFSVSTGQIKEREGRAYAEIEDTIIGQQIMEDTSKGRFALAALDFTARTGMEMSRQDLMLIAMQVDNMVHTSVENIGRRMDIGFTESEDEEINKRLRDTVLKNKKELTIRMNRIFEKKEMIQDIMSDFEGEYTEEYKEQARTIKELYEELELLYLGTFSMEDEDMNKYIRALRNSKDWADAP